MTDYLIKKLSNIPNLKRLSPLEAENRGSHVSLIVENTDMKLFLAKLFEYGVQGDLRKYSNKGDYLLRVSPVGLYNTRDDMDTLVSSL